MIVPFEKMAHFILCKDKMKSEQQKDLILKYVWELHEVVDNIVFDRARIFIWKSKIEVDRYHRA